MVVKSSVSSLPIRLGTAKRSMGGLCRFVNLKPQGTTEYPCHCLYGCDYFLCNMYSYAAWCLAARSGTMTWVCTLATGSSARLWRADDLHELSRKINLMNLIVLGSRQGWGSQRGVLSDLWHCISTITLLWTELRRKSKRDIFSLCSIYFLAAFVIFFYFHHSL